MTLLCALLACATAPEPPVPPPEPEPEPVDPIEADPAVFSGLGEPEQLDYLRVLGAHVYEHEGSPACTACHRADGTGLRGAFPPLAGIELGTCAAEARVVLRGHTGRTERDGVPYEGVMLPYAEQLDDLRIAAVLTWVRTSWGHDAGPCMPDDVAEQRAIGP